MSEIFRAPLLVSTWAPGPKHRGRGGGGKGKERWTKWQEGDQDPTACKASPVGSDLFQNMTVNSSRRNRGVGGWGGFRQIKEKGKKREEKWRSRKKGDK